MNIVKNDEVIVIAGNHKGKTGKVRRVIKDKSKVIVEGINMVTRHTKPSQTSPEGGRIEKEAAIHISNVSLIDPDTKKPTRVRAELDKNGNKKRIAVKSGKEIKKQIG
ncbi:MAG: 50S ribosomal protein L24 [Calditrichaeota bacterium]|nr:50S ribosomal protein L24 [Calditrichota bacterium]